MKKSKAIHMVMLVAIMFALFLGGIIIFKTHKTSEEIAEDVPVEPKEPTVDLNKIESISGKYYYEDDHFTSMFGIDVSEHQNNIDWRKVKDDSVEFAYLRIGRRGATEGKLYPDEHFEENYNGVIANGIKLGVYFFSQAIDEKEAIEEAHWVLDTLNGRKVDLPIVYDCEEVHMDDAVSRITLLEKEQLTRNAIAFMEEIKKNGYDAMFYAYPYWASTYIDMEKLKDYPLWYAQYDGTESSFEYPVTIWQYSAEGTINGIEGETDLNIMFTRKNDQSE